MQLQDEVVYVLTKVDLDVQVMDLVSFWALYDSLQRLACQEDMRIVNLHRLAQHGDEKAMKEHTEHYEQRLKSLGMKIEKRADGQKFVTDLKQASFLRAFGNVTGG